MGLAPADSRLVTEADVDSKWIQVDGDSVTRYGNGDRHTQ